MGEGFILRRWIVSVEGHSDSFYLASSRGKAIASAWRDYASCYDVAFGDFIRRAKCRLDRMVWPNSKFGDPITVGGEPGFYCGHNSQYVQFARPGGDFTLNAHPYDVEPEEYRPHTYRSARQPNDRPSAANPLSPAHEGKA